MIYLCVCVCVCLTTRSARYHDATFGRVGAGGLPRRDEATGLVEARKPKGVARGMHFRGPPDAPPPNVAALIAPAVAPPPPPPAAAAAAAAGGSYAARALARRHLIGAPAPTASLEHIRAGPRVSVVPKSKKVPAQYGQSQVRGAALVPTYSRHL